MLALVWCAVPLIGSLVQLQPDSGSDAAAWKKAGLSAAAVGRLDTALTAFAKACALAPKDQDACYYLGRTLFSLDRWEEAEKAFRLAIEAAPKPILARVHRAAALNFVALHRPEEADAQFREAVRLNPAREELSPELTQDPRIDYGAFLFRQGRLGESLSMLRAAAQSLPTVARAHAELGRTLLHLGNIDEAVRSLERAVSLDPRSRNFHLMLGRAYLQGGRAADGQRQLALAETAQDSSSLKQN